MRNSPSCRGRTFARPVVLLIGALALPVAGSGAQPQPKVFYACYVPGSGVVYRIKEPNLPTECSQKGPQPHIEFSWTDGVTGGDHGALAGLGDDDHSQYVLANGVRAATNGFAVTGTVGAGIIPIAGPGTRVMWYPGKAAFRAGFVDGAQWDDASVGAYSVAMGQRPTASGPGSVALGRSNTASGDYSAAFGINNVASGNASTTSGQNSIASGTWSVAMGSNAQASGDIATALGGSTTASGNFSTALGKDTEASGGISTAIGHFAKATGAFTTAIGAGTTAQALASVVIGGVNVVSGDPLQWIPTDPLFVVGNGPNALQPSNALTLLKNGDMTIAGALTQASDIRLKEEVEPLTGVLERVLKLTPIRYRFRDGLGHPAGPRLGLSAQEVQPLFPELVRSDGEGYLAVAYSELSAVLVAAVREQQRALERARGDAAALSARVAELEEAVRQLTARGAPRAER